VRKHLANLVDFAISFLDGVAKKLEKDWPRRTELGSFHQVDVKEAARKDIPLRYDSDSGYLGTSVNSGEILAHVSEYNKMIAIRRNGIYTAMTIPEKLFVDKGALYFGNAEKEELSKVLFTVVYREAETGYPYIKRCHIEQYINNRDYSLVPDGASILLFSTEANFDFTVVYEPKSRMKVKEEAFRASDFEEKGLKALGIRLAAKPAASAALGVSKLAAKAARAVEEAAGSEEPFPEAKTNLTRAKKAPKKGEAKVGLRAKAEAAAKAAAKKRAHAGKGTKKK